MSETVPPTMAILPKESYDTVVCTMLPVKKRLTFLPSDLVMVICAVLVPFQVAKEMSLDALVSLMWPKESYFHDARLSVFLTPLGSSTIACKWLFPYSE